MRVLEQLAEFWPSNGHLTIWLACAVAETGGQVETLTYRRG